MKAIRMYLDEAAERGIIKNDSELARAIGVSRQSVNDWRKGRTSPNEDQAAALADLLGKPEIMAECMAARAKPGAHRAAWERLAKIASMSAAFSAVAFVALYTTDAQNLLLLPALMTGQLYDLPIMAFITTRAEGVGNRTSRPTS